MLSLQPTNGPRLWKKILRQFPAGSVIAGGAVRDYLLGLAPKDIDVFVPVSRWPTDPDYLRGFYPLEGDRDNEYAALTNIAVIARGYIDGFQVDAVGVTDEVLKPAEFVRTFDFGLTRCWFDGRRIQDTPEAAADRASRTVSLLIADRAIRAAERFERFNRRAGGQWRLSPDPLAIPEHEKLPL